MLTNLCSKTESYRELSTCLLFEEKEKELLIGASYIYFEA